MSLQSFAKKIFSIWLIVFFLATPVLGARVAHAQMNIFADLPRTLEWIKNGIVDFIKNTMQAAIVTALINTISFAADRLAYDAAVRIATGGPAEDPLYDGTPNQTYLGNLAADMAGEAIGSLSETIEGAGGLLSNFDLCAPSTPYIMLQFKFGIKGVFDRPEPKCDFNKMFGPEGTWTSFVADLSQYRDSKKNEIILAELANMYDPQKSEFGVGLGLSTDIFGETTFLPLVGTEEKIKNNGFKDVADFITGNVETPANILQDQVTEAQKNSGNVRQQATFAMLGNKDLLLQIGIHAGSVFTNTLLSKIQEQIWQGLFDFETTDTDPFDPDSFTLNTSQDAAEHYRSLLTAAPLQISNYSILSEFVTCPGSDSRGLYNCVMDSNFASAVARADAGAPETIQEAIDDGLLDGSWPLIPAADVARNQDAYCYSYGFCYGNLVKMRKARIISIGWELAASSSANAIENPVTLQEVIDGFNSCGTDGLPDDNHPWCKMIDPDWVLKYPDTQCRMQAYGELLLADQSDERGQACVDMPSCIAEDENGNCVGGYGYCVAEENTWNFRGESCPEYAASCLVFEDSEGNSEAYLRNTVDPGPCTEDSVGCRWYATQKEEQEDGSFAYAAVESISDANASGTTYTSRIYFNNQVEECNEENGGCSTLIERTTDLRLNTVFNPSFEIDDDTNEFPDGWYEYHIGGASWPSEVSTDGTYAHEDDSAMSPGQASSGRGAIYQPGIELGQARSYTLSFYARQLADGDTDTIDAILDLHDETGSTVDIAGLAISGDCDDTYTNILGSAVSTGVGIEDVQPDSADYERFTCTFTVPPLSDTSLKIYGDLYFLNFDGYIDSIQLEQGEDASVPVKGYSDTAYTTTVAKVAPAYLGCTGSSDDPEECANYAQVCSEQDMGCTLYTPTNGDPAISGIATELDECPSECAGYDTYRQEATRYEPDGVDAVYFIPDTATECSAEEVGCDEFTNLSTEAQEYYTFMRACVTEAQADANVSSDNGATFYTWEGSDESGYQLRTWTLLESNAGSSDYTQIGSDGATDTAPDQAPCSNWTATEDGITCNDTEDTDGDGYYDWDTEDCNTRADIFTNAGCREFYDENGNIHYRDWENTVTVNDACQAYRKTTIAGDDETARETTCQESGGYYAPDSGACVYYGYSEESTSCDESANGCREYAGGRSRNSRLVFEDVFEDGTLNNWDASSASDATYSNESLASDGHSMLMTSAVTTFTGDYGSDCADSEGCEESARSFGGTCTVTDGSQYCGTLADNLYAGKTYTVSVVAKGTGTLEVGFDFEADPASPSIDLPFDSAVELEDGWQQLNFGPLIMDADTYPLFGDGTTLVLKPTGTAYVDNVVLREGEEGITVIRDSWVTPASCDESLTGATNPQYYLGCQEYSTQDGETVYLKSLSSLCDEDKVGCDAFFKTQESENVAAETKNATCNNSDGDGDGNADTASSPTACYYFTDASGNFDEDAQYLCTISTGETSCLFSQDGYTPDWMLPSHLSYGPETVIVPPDEDMFLVVTDEVTCQSDAAGCTELGDPTWSQDRESTEGAESVYLMNLPDTYDSILCTHEELFCDAFTTNDATTYYFKHPMDQTCEYRTDVTVDGTVYDGWFRTGTDDFCYGTCVDSSGGEGDACGSSADCGSGETCDASVPSYVIGGTASGIWNNGDDEYRDWAGTCSTTYDTCTEFQDKLAQNDGELYGETDGTSYFYLNNDSLSEYGLADSQKCDGQVSLKNGCAMFYDTGDTSLTASASATEVASRHADVMFGSEPYGLVDPIDCENSGDTTITTSDGTEIDLCATRCTYDMGEVYDLADGDSYTTKLGDERAGTEDYDRDDMYTFGGACYDITDCPSIRSESGADVEAISCATQVRVDPYSFTSSFGGSFGAWSSRTLSAGYTAVPRLENDTNTVLKVNRDRACSEWLSCSSTTTQWDESTASFMTTCNDIALCTGYDAASGTTFCSDWDFDKPEVLYGADWYAGRDTSWYGNEYSGMTIPNMFPVQSLTQADVGPDLYCVDTAEHVLYEAGSCETEGDTCGGAQTICMTREDAIAEGAVSEDDEDYALVLNAGSCDEDYGASCAVGYCEDTGAACSTSDQCSSGSCLVGACYNLAEDTDDVDSDGDVAETVTCQTAADCNEGQTCYGGACADVGDDVAIEYYDAETGDSSCASDETFVGNAELKLGSCINEQCLLTPSGDAYEDGATEGKICRAYPENTSPFLNDVVDAWYDTANPGSRLDAGEEDENARPYDFVSGFENVNTCAYGEDCDCSYTKVSYGQGEATRYYGMDWSPDFSICGGALEDHADAGHVCTESGDCSSSSCVSVQDQLGVCATGSRTGGYCTADEQCGEGNICSKSTREDVIYGLNGFCLEHDTSTNILGDRNKQACISWLPVDQLAGDTDLRAKYSGAGYFNDVYLCAETKPFSILQVSVHEDIDHGIACAEEDGPVDEVDADDSGASCADAVSCPDGFFAVVGAAVWTLSSANGYLTDRCTDGAGDNDCPYICVPKDSSKYDSASESYDTGTCDPEQYGLGDGGKYTGANGIDVYYVTGGDADGVDNSTDADEARAELYQAFDDAVDHFEDCMARGVLLSTTDEADVSSDIRDITNHPMSDTDNPDESSSGGDGYRSLRFTETQDGEISLLESSFSPYAACAVMTQVATVDESYAWTDRVYKGYALSVSTPSTAYTQETNPEIFGLSGSSPTVQDRYGSPMKVAQCFSDSYAVTPSSEFTTCDEGYEPSDAHTTTDPGGDSLEARSYSAFALYFTGLMTNTNANRGPGTGDKGVYTSTWSEDDIWGTGDTDESFTGVTQVFAGISFGKSWTWNGEVDTGGDYRGYATEEDTSDKYADKQIDVRPSEGNPPTVWSVDTQSCSDDGTLCEEGIESRITLNSQDTGDQSGSQFFNATVKFYAAADKNQLPIRRIMIDWGDDLEGGNYTGSEAEDNFYKNARGLQEGTQNSQCDLDTEWGLTDESCDPYYYSYNHIYTCSSEILRDSGAACDGDGSTGDANGDFPCWLDQSGDGAADACVFQPRVFVRDNWGWCTGSCDSTDPDTGVDPSHTSDVDYSDNTTTCYDYDGSLSGSPRDSDECNYSENSAYRPWVPYDGVIVVTP